MKGISRFLSALGHIVLAIGLCCGAALAQDMMQHVDLSSPQMTEAEMSRDELLAMIQAGGSAEQPDLSGKRLSGLDLSEMDFRGANLRGAYLNNVKLAGANLDGAILDQAWALKADFSGASLRQASLVASQMRGARLDRADLSGARVTADLQGASLLDAILAEIGRAHV